jgi:PAS domain-containing protein
LGYSENKEHQSVDTTILLVDDEERILRMPGEKIRARTANLQEEIEERKRTEEALRESEHKLRNIIEGSPSGIVLCDEEGIISVRWKRLKANWLNSVGVGKSRSSLSGSVLRDDFDPEDELTS